MPAERGPTTKGQMTRRETGPSSASRGVRTARRGGRKWPGVRRNQKAQRRRRREELPVTRSSAALREISRAALRDDEHVSSDRHRFAGS